MKSSVYFATLISDKKDGGFVVTFKDFPEAITQGKNVEDSLLNASDCLEEAIANRIEMNLPIPKPSRKKPGQYPVSLHIHMAVKVALYNAIRESNITKIELAKRLDCDEKEIRRMLDPHHFSKIRRIESALSIMGKRLIVEVQAL